MADEDNFDIDIYGDETGQENVNTKESFEGNEDFNGNGSGQGNYSYDNNQESEAGGGTEGQFDQQNGSNSIKLETKTSSVTMDDTASSTTIQPSSEPLPQGVKRKGMDERQVDPTSTNAIQITELHWWITEDDLRGWCANAGCEDEVRDITFNEHKVNGKSKGYEQLTTFHV
jgi:hypothetical protein